MIENTSRTDGYLTPPAGSPAPEYDGALDGVFQRHVVGVTGLPGNMVRPRWQSKPPTHPGAEADWCAVGVLSITPVAGPFIVHNGTDETNPDDGQDRREWHEDVIVQASFYGPRAQHFAALLKDGCGIPQNNDQIKKSGLSFIGAGTITSAADLLNQQWIQREDISLTFRRKTVRLYNVRNFAGATINYTR